MVPQSAGSGERRAAYRAVECKRHATIQSVDQLIRYLEFLNRDPLLAPVRGVLACLSITPQARTLAADRGVEVRVVDYDELKGRTDSTLKLF